MEGQQLPTYLILSYLETKLFLKIPRKIISPVSYWVIAMNQEQEDLQISESLNTVEWAKQAWDLDMILKFRYSEKATQFEKIFHFKFDATQ